MEKKLINTQDIIKSQVKVSALSRKNSNVIIQKNDKIRYLIKHFNSFENDFYRYNSEKMVYKIANLKSVSHLKTYFPNLVSYDDNYNIIILQYIENIRSLHEFFYAGNISGSDLLFKGLGETLGLIHKGFVNLDRSKLSFLSNGIPTIFFLSKPSPEALVTLSPANIELLKILQNHMEFANFSSAYKKWSKKTLVHCDLKLDNILYSADLRIAKIIDWEFAAIGDPAWDISRIIQEFIMLWFFFLPLNETLISKSMEEVLLNENISLDVIQSGLNLFWKSYLQSAKIEDSTEINELLLKSVEFSAIQLIHGVYEVLYSKSVITDQIYYLIQLGGNILKDPYTAASQLIGIRY